MNSFWRSCLSHFEQQLPPQQFKTWIKPLKFQAADNLLTLTAPNRFVLQWIRDRFLAEIQRLAAERFGVNVIINLVLAEKETLTCRRRRWSPRAAAINPVPAISRVSTLNSLLKLLSRARPTSWRARQQFRSLSAPGKRTTRCSSTAALGLGKTHLIHAIGNLLLQRNPQSRIRYIHAEQYVSDVVRAYQHKAFDDFKRYYHSLDLLLIDDIQFFSGKSRTQEEFFYAFNALIESRKQVVITCDTYPREIPGIENRLISRFAWGLTVAVEPPELEMRVAILFKKAEAENVLLDQTVAFFIATHSQSNIRELEGALKRILAYSRFSGRQISVDLCRDALKDLLALQSRQISIDNIQKTVADYYKIKVSEMYSKKRSRNIARPRQVAMALAKELTHLSLPDIGEAFGGRDHTTRPARLPKNCGAQDHQLRNNKRF